MKAQELDELLDRLISMAVEDQRMDQSIDTLLVEDTVYRQDAKDEEELEKRVRSLDVSQGAMAIFADYVACIRSSDKRYADISFAAGFKDGVHIALKAVAIEKELGMEGMVVPSLEDMDE
ncbi:MAG: hypothetical protein LUH07_08020 [Lachnospiraceae bacterium]|nr:hypothetical protein [Lachnospiraceae bacterium]